MDSMSSYHDMNETFEKLHYYNGETWVTGIDNEQLSIYRKAVDLYANNNLFILNKTYDSCGRLVKNGSSLHTNSKEDLSKFWVIFDELESR